MKKILIFMFFILSLALNRLCAQSDTATIPYYCDFETNTERAYWTFTTPLMGGSLNNWRLGIANQSQGMYGLYVSNDNGISNLFGIERSIAFAYRKIMIPQGVYDIGYNYICNGKVDQSPYAYFRAFLLPGSYYTLNGLSPLLMNTLPADAIPLDGGTALSRWTTWNTYVDTALQVPATQVYYLVFYWYNDAMYSASSYYQPPAAIDYIRLRPHVVGVGMGLNSVATPVVKLYPNPAASFATLTIEGANGEVDYSLIDLSGRIVRHKTVNAASAERIDLSGLANGTYFVRVTNENFSKVEKLVVSGQ